MQSWYDTNKLELISAPLEIRDNLITGEFKTQNCHGKEKEIPLKDLLDLTSYQTVYACGESRRNKEFLAISDKSYFKPFR